MSQQLHNDQRKAESMDNTPPSKQSSLSCDPTVLAVLLVFVLFLSALLPSAWSLIIGATVVGLGIRWGVLWYGKYQRRKL